MNKIQSGIKKYGINGLIRLALAPLTTLFTTPYRLVYTIIKSIKILKFSELNMYSGFTIKKSFINLFYWTRALNIKRYGRRNICPYIGLGNKTQSRFYFYTLLSLYLFWKSPIITLLSGMLLWLLSHIMWLESVSNLWIVLVMLLAVISTTFYSNTFQLQNYNVLGWCFFPLIIFGSYFNNWILVATSLLMISFTSLTVLVISNVFILLTVIIHWNFILLIALIPANIKFIFHLYNLYKSNNLINLLQILGSTRKKVRYQRQTTKGKDLLLNFSYYFILYAQFIISYLLVVQEFSPLIISAIAFLILFHLNSFVFRLADLQSMHMIFFSINTAIIIYSESYLLLPFYWLAISPIPLIAFGFNKLPFIDQVPTLFPVSVLKFIQDMEEFFKGVSQKSRVLFAFSNPNGVYDNIFDGYRSIYELPIYVASLKKIHLIPDWWAVAETNYEGAPDFWGRDIESVTRNIELWNADYVIIYQTGKSDLESNWIEAGFKVVSKYSWKNYMHLFQEDIPFKGEAPDWWLLKIPANVN